MQGDVPRYSDAAPVVHQSCREGLQIERGSTELACVAAGLQAPPEADREVLGGALMGAKDYLRCP